LIEARLSGSLYNVVQKISRILLMDKTSKSDFDKLLARNLDKIEKQELITALLEKTRPAREKAFVETYTKMKNERKNYNKRKLVEDLKLPKDRAKDGDLQKLTRITIQNMYDRAKAEHPDIYISKATVQEWLKENGRQSLENMNERQLGLIKWNDKTLAKFRDIDVENMKFKNRKIVKPEDIQNVIKDEYEKLPPNISRDTFDQILKKKYIGISRRATEKFLKLQPMYQMSTRRITEDLAKPIVLSKPFQRCLIDTIDSSKISKEGAQYPHTLTCIDGFSKFAYAVPLKDNKAETVEVAFRSILKKVIDKGGKPWSVCQMDNGTEFLGMENVNWGQYKGETISIKFIRSSPYMPWSNGIIERVHGYIKPHIYWAQEKEKIPYPIQLQKVLDIYNDRKHSVTKVAPNQVHRLSISAEVKALMKGRINVQADKIQPKNRQFEDIVKDDYVRIAVIRRSKIEKKYQNWSEKVYQVSQVRKDNTYKIIDIGGKNDGKVRPYIYQRDYLHKIPKETGIAFREEVEKMNAEEKERLATKEAEEEILREELRKKDEERLTLKWDFDKWTKYFAENKELTFQIPKGRQIKYKVLNLYKISSIDNYKEKYPKKVHKDWILNVYRASRKRKPALRNENQYIDVIFKDSFVKNWLKMTNHSILF